MVGGPYGFEQVLVITDGDKITVADLDGEILIEHTRPAPGVTYVGNGRPRGPRPRPPKRHRCPDTSSVTDVLMQNCHRCPETSQARGRVSVGLRRIEHMIERQAMAPEAEVHDDLTASELLALARDRKTAEDRAAADLLELAARWADLHPPESIHSAAVFTVAGCEHEEPIAGEGCPSVAEFCVAELGAVLGMSTVSAKKLIGHALELRHRLPRLWAQVQSGAVAPGGPGRSPRPPSTPPPP